MQTELAYFLIIIISIAIFSKVFAKLILNRNITINFIVIVSFLRVTLGKFSKNKLQDELDLLFYEEYFSS